MTISPSLPALLILHYTIENQVTEKYSFNSFLNRGDFTCNGFKKVIFHHPGALNTFYQEFWPMPGLFASMVVTSQKQHYIHE